MTLNKENVSVLAVLYTYSSKYVVFKGELSEIKTNKRTPNYRVTIPLVARFSIYNTLN